MLRATGQIALLALVFAAFVPVMAGEEEGPDTETDGIPWKEIEKSPERLVPLLGHDAWKVREKATALLDRLGEKALEELRKAFAHEDAEVSTRASKLHGAIVNRVQRLRLKLVIAAPKKSFKFGEMINLTVKFENTYDEPLTVCQCLDGSFEKMRLPHYTFDIRRVVKKGEEETEVPVQKLPRLRCGNVNALKTDDFKELQPGEEFDPSKWLPREISGWHDMKTPGTYRVTLVYVFNAEGLNPPRALGAASPKTEPLIEKALKGEIRSNTITVEVKG